MTAIAKGAYVELSLACRGIPRMDVASKSDPFCIVYADDGEDLDQVCMTETIYDTHSCKWVQKVVLQATDKRVFKFDIYDRDSVRDVLKDHDYIGSCQKFALSSVLNTIEKSVELDIERQKDNKSYGTLIINADAVLVRTPNTPVHLQVALQSSEGVKYYFQITKLLVCGTFFPVYRSELLERAACFFKPIALKLSILCGGDPCRSMQLEIYEYHSMGRSKAMGYCPFTISDIQSASSESSLAWKKAKGNLNFNVSLSTSPLQDGGLGMKVVFKDCKKSLLGRS